jgi:hypothetical protein
MHRSRFERGHGYRLAANADWETVLRMIKWTIAESDGVGFSNVLAAAGY